MALYRNLVHRNVWEFVVNPFYNSSTRWLILQRIPSVQMSLVQVTRYVEMYLQ